MALETSPPAKPKSYPALLLTQNEHRFYFSTIPVDDLFPFCFVARRDEQPEDGFQRTLSKDRAEDIARYLAEGAGSIPTNVVLSAQPDAGFAYTRKTKSISFQRVPQAFLVLDGQHRLWGYQKCEERHRVPVAIYEGLTRPMETRLFIDINTNQRGVPAALLLDIKQLAEVESQKEGRLRLIFDKMATDPKSPLYGKLSAAKSVPGKISRVTFNRAVGLALDGGVAQGLNTDEAYALVRNFLNALDAELGDKSLLTRASYFEAVFDLFDELVRATIQEKGNAKQDSLQGVVRSIAKIDYATGVAGLTKKNIASLMLGVLRKTVKLSSEML